MWEFVFVYHDISTNCKQILKNTNANIFLVVNTIDYMSIVYNIDKVHHIMVEKMVHYGRKSIH